MAVVLVFAFACSFILVFAGGGLLYDWSYSDSLYFAVVSFSTVGLGDSAPTREFYQDSRWLWLQFAFFDALVLFGVCLLATWVGAVRPYTLHSCAKGSSQKRACKQLTLCFSFAALETGERTRLQPLGFVPERGTRRVSPMESSIASNLSHTIRHTLHAGMERNTWLRPFTVYRGQCESTVAAPAPSRRKR